MATFMCMKVNSLFIPVETYRAKWLAHIRLLFGPINLTVEIHFITDAQLVFKFFNHIAGCLPLLHSVVDQL